MGFMAQGGGQVVDTARGEAECCIRQRDLIPLLLLL